MTKPQSSTAMFVGKAIESVFAHMYFPDSDPPGQTLSAGFSPVGSYRIVGVDGM